MSRIVPALRLRTSPRQSSKEGEATATAQENERTTPRTTATTPKSPSASRTGSSSKLSGLKKKLTSPPKFGRSKSDRDVSRAKAAAAADTIAPRARGGKAKLAPHDDKPSSPEAGTGLAKWRELLMEEKTASMDDSLIVPKMSAAARRELEPESDSSASDSEDGGGYVSPGRGLSALVSPRQPLGRGGGSGVSASSPQESRNCAQAKALAALRAAQPHVFER